MLSSLPRSGSSIFLNYTRFASDRITMLSSLLTHFSPSCRKNLLIAISDLTRLEMEVRESSIDFMSQVRNISQRVKGLSMEKIIPIFIIASLDHDCYPGVKSRHLDGDPALVNCDLLIINGKLLSEETRQQEM